MTNTTKYTSNRYIFVTGTSVFTNKPYCHTTTGAKPGSHGRKLSCNGPVQFKKRMAELKGGPRLVTVLRFGSDKAANQYARETTKYLESLAA